MANYTILLIDYEPRSIERFRQPLTDAGYTVEVATDGLTGIEAFRRLSPDMVLVEAMIPKKHGFEVCQELKRTPHGRRTPVLITTGVYKGRKYRTQALHIYGCDEYIEKPIAPEQLLAVVGKFFGPAAVATTTPAAESRTAAPAEAAVISVSDGPARGGIGVVESNEPAPSRPSPAKASPSSVAKDFTEEEIMARLDAILPSGDFAQPSEPPASPIAVAAGPEPIPTPPLPMGGEAVEAQDPFSQMQAELTAELGSMSAALALEPAPVFEPMEPPIPSDQVVSPSVLEALPVPESEKPPTVSVQNESHVDVERVAEAPVNEPPGQLVNFDAKRSRRKKGGKKSAPQTPVPIAPEPRSVAPTMEFPPTQAQPPVRTKLPVGALSLPAGTLAESDLTGTTSKKRVPIWIWAALAAIALIAVYFTVVRGRSTPSVATSAETSTTGSLEDEPIVADSEATKSAPPDTRNSNLVLNSISPSERPSPAPTPKPVSGSPPATDKVAPAERPQPSTVVSAIALWTPGGAPARAAKATAKTSTVTDAPFPGQIEDDKTTTAPPQTLPSASVEEGVPGVEPITDASAQQVAASIAPGTLVSADELDTAPVSLSRKLPTYSLQARQMRAEGTVVMKVLVNERGTVDEVVLVSGAPGADLNKSAMRAAKSWTYRPATKGGVAVKVWKIEQVAFKL